MTSEEKIRGHQKQFDKVTHCDNGFAFYLRITAGGYYIRSAAMFWAKRRFGYADYAPYQDRLQQLMLANSARHAEFIMVSCSAEDHPGMGDYYVGVPTQDLLAGFDGFEPVAERDLPKEIDTLLIADATKEPFKSRFRWRAS
jgi:hypothetical protein